MALRVATGTYTGTSAIQTVTVTPSFAIKLLLIKTTSADASSDGASLVTDTLGSGFIEMFQNNTIQSSAITAVGTGSFSLSSSALLNNSSITYSYIALGGTSADFFTGSYAGNGSTQSITAPGFLPSGVFFVKGTNGPPAVGNFGQGNTDSSEFYTAGQANLTGRITALNANGFSVGNNSEVNAGATTYYYAAFPDIPGQAKSGSYTGNTTGQSITGLGFQPDVVIIKGNNVTNSITKTSGGTTGTNSLPFDAMTAQITTGITSLDADGFTVATDIRVNTIATTYLYMAFKESPPVVVSTRLFTLLGVGT